MVLPRDVAADRNSATDMRGRPLPSQRLGDGRLAVLVDRVPALGALRLALSKAMAFAPGLPARVETDLTIDNGILRVAVDRTTGDIRSLRSSRAPGKELASPSRGLNSYLYVAGRDPSQAVGPGIAHVFVDEPGSLVATLRIESSAPGARSLVRRVTVTSGGQLVEIEDVLDKTAVRAKESAHVAFPFNLPDATVRVDEGAAIVVPERDQLDGSCRDFIGVHSAVDLSAGGVGVSVATLDAPLMELGAITDERQDPKARVRAWRAETAAGSTVYAYLLNNYWHTNYKADQEGVLVFRFALRPHGAFDEVALRRFGAEQEQPLLAYVVDARAPMPRAPFRVEGAGVTVSSIRAAGDGGSLIVRLYNASRSRSVARLVASRPDAPIRVARVEQDGRVLLTNDGTVVFKPFATELVRVTPASQRR